MRFMRELARPLGLTQSEICCHFVALGASVVVTDALSL
jgi:hypothetical protein